MKSTRFTARNANAATFAGQPDKKMQIITQDLMIEHTSMCLISSYNRNHAAQLPKCYWSSNCVGKYCQFPDYHEMCEA